MSTIDQLSRPLVVARPEVRVESTHTPLPHWWLRLNMIALALAIVPTTLRVLGSLSHNDSWSYAATEWLINSRGGISRRGLSGDVLLGVPVLPDRAGVVLTVLALAIVVPVGFASLVKRSMVAAGSPWPLLFWLLPGGLVLGTLQSNVHDVAIGMADYSLRKEQLFLAGVLAVVLASLRWPSRRAWTLIAVSAAIALAALAFVHEGLTVVAGGCIAYYLFWLHPNPPARSVTLALPGDHGRWPVPTVLALVAPAVVAVGFLAAATAHAVPDRHAIWLGVDAVTREWLPADTVHVMGGDTGLPPAIWWLGTDPEAGWRMAFDTYVHSGAWSAWLLTVVVIVGWVLGAGALADTRTAAIRSAAVTVAVVIALTSPLFVIAIDWGRWSVLIGVLSAILLLGRPAGATGTGPHPARTTRFGYVAAAVLAVIGLAMEIPVGGVDFWLAQLLT